MCCCCGEAIATASGGHGDWTLVAPTEDEIAVDEDVQIKEELDMETESLKQARDPGQPTARQVEEHRRTHVPYRVWCRWCWLGRGRGIQHRRTPGSAVPIIGID